LVAKRLRFTMKEAIGKGKGVTTNKNGLGVELISKNSKAQSNEIGVVVCANTIVCPLVEKLNFLHMNS
jgi:hypothetical protein